MRYSIDVRKKVMNYLDKGHTIKETSEVFDVGTTTIKRWKRLRAESGSLEHRTHKRTCSKICPDRLVAYISEHPDSFLIEIAAIFNCTPQAVFYALKRLGITRKKNG
jgi:transposase